jgi:tRNA A-37 threonylcarbamoyl transferase component Bud32
MFDAISEFHTLGFIHKDIKFDNFTINEGTVYLIDYGMSVKIAE